MHVCHLIYPRVMSAMSLLLPADIYTQCTQSMIQTVTQAQTLRLYYIVNVLSVGYFCNHQ